jgi:hypothetical protein
MSILDTPIIAFTSEQRADVLRVGEITAQLDRLVMPALVAGDVMRGMRLQKVARLARDVVRAWVGEVGHV